MAYLSRLFVGQYRNVLWVIPAITCVLVFVVYASRNNRVVQVERFDKEIEGEYERRIEQILAPIVGEKRVSAKVTVEIDSAHVATTEETYDPDKAVVKSSVKSDEVARGSEKNAQESKYAIPKKIHRIEKPSGSIKRLTVAVIVEGFTPSGDEELKRLHDIIANTIGYDAQRRDSIHLTFLPGKASPLDMRSSALLIQVVLLAVMMILGGFLLFRGIRARKTPKTDTASKVATEAEVSMQVNVSTETPGKEELKEKIIEQLTTSPKKVLRILQDWLDEEKLANGATS